ncbi:hypothetical protein E5D57_000196 [Metarhizium anisopliae]|nr:hypothetical protein E5D57_010981 [Metarhizium anisopliae]KAF5136434.1 hypothetical protein E5D57_000196 [Metarhizium anisopliae]
MPTVNGTLNHISPNRFTASFFIKGVVYQFPATVSPGLPTYTTNNTILKYTSVNDLTSTHHFSGVMGVNKFELAEDNGPIIKGDLNEPGIVPAITVDGSGQWESF